MAACNFRDENLYRTYLDSLARAFPPRPANDAADTVMPAASRTATPSTSRSSAPVLTPASVGRRSPLVACTEAADRVVLQVQWLPIKSF